MRKNGAEEEGMAVNVLMIVIEPQTQQQEQQ